MNSLVGHIFQPSPKSRPLLPQLWLFRLEKTRKYKFSKKENGQPRHQDDKRALNKSRSFEVFKDSINKKNKAPKNKSGS